MSAIRFVMVIEDVFSIKASGQAEKVVVTGKPSSGAVRVADELFLKRAHDLIKVTAIGVESFNKPGEADGGSIGIGIMLRGVARSDVSVGDTLDSFGPEA